MRLLNLRRAARAVAGGGPGPEGNVTKLLGSEYAHRIAALCARIAAEGASPSTARTGGRMMPSARARSRSRGARPRSCATRSASGSSACRATRCCAERASGAVWHSLPMTSTAPSSKPLPPVEQVRPGAVENPGAAAHPPALRVRLRVRDRPSVSSSSTRGGTPTTRSTPWRAGLRQERLRDVGRAGRDGHAHPSRPLRPCRTGTASTPTPGSRCIPPTPH